MINANTPLLDSLTRIDASRVRSKVSAYLIHTPGRTYAPGNIDFVTTLYNEVCLATGVNLEFALIQMVHETGALTSVWSQPPNRNPAGLGVTGEPGAGLHFSTWALSVPAHVGRILAYQAEQSTTRYPADAAAAMTLALGYRSLPDSRRGQCTTVGELAKFWATDRNYVGSLTRLSSAILGGT